MNNRDLQITWRAPEYDHRNKSTDWFWGVGIIGVVSAVVAIVLGNLLFGIFIIIGTFALVLQALRVPKTVEFSVTERGIQIDKTLYPYGTLESFWITDDEPQKLLVKSGKVFMPIVTIPISGVDSEMLREYILDFLDEEEQTEPLSQHLMEYIGF